MYLANYGNCSEAVRKEIEKSAKRLFLAAKHFCTIITENNAVTELCGNLDKLIEEDKELLKIGLTNEPQEFYHRNFLEYFFSIFVLGQLCKTNKAVLINQDVNNFFVQEILTSYLFRGVKRFLNEQLHFVDNELKSGEWKVHIESLPKFTHHISEKSLGRIINEKKKIKLINHLFFPVTP